MHIVLCISLYASSLLHIIILSSYYASHYIHHSLCIQFLSFHFMQFCILLYTYHARNFISCISANASYQMQHILYAYIISLHASYISMHIVLIYHYMEFCISFHTYHARHFILCISTYASYHKHLIICITSYMHLITSHLNCTHLCICYVYCLVHFNCC